MEELIFGGTWGKYRSAVVTLLEKKKAPIRAFVNYYQV